MGLGAISRGKNVTLKMIEKYPDKPWNWTKIGMFYIFEKDKEMEIKKLKFKQIEEELIQKTWHPSRFQDWCLNDYEKRRRINIINIKLIVNYICINIFYCFLQWCYNTSKTNCRCGSRA